MKINIPELVFCHSEEGIREDEEEISTGKNDESEKR